MIKKLKDILNTYTDEELEKIELWVNLRTEVESIIIDEDSINLISSENEIDINEG